MVSSKPAFNRGTLTSIHTMKTWTRKSNLIEFWETLETLKTITNSFPLFLTLKVWKYICCFSQGHCATRKKHIPHFGSGSLKKTQKIPGNFPPWYKRTRASEAHETWCTSSFLSLTRAELAASWPWKRHQRSDNRGRPNFAKPGKHTCCLPPSTTWLLYQKAETISV